MSSGLENGVARSARLVLPFYFFPACPSIQSCPPPNLRLDSSLARVVHSTLARTDDSECARSGRKSAWLAFRTCFSLVSASSGCLAGFFLFFSFSAPSQPFPLRFAFLLCVLFFSNAEECNPGLLRLFPYYLFLCIRLIRIRNLSAIPQTVVLSVARPLFSVGSSRRPPDRRWVRLKVRGYAIARPGLEVGGMRR